MTQPRSPSTELGRLLADLGRLPVEVRREAAPLMRRAAEPVAAKARANASWSTRIPGAIRVRASASRRRPGVRFTVSTRRAPHARLYEFGQDKRGFRHPVFGNREVWVQQSVRPYLMPAIRAGRREFVSAADEAVGQAARRLGWR